MRFPGVAAALASLVVVASTPAATGTNSASATAQGLVVNGRAVFPIMVFRECPWAVPGLLDLGINTFMGSCDRRESAMVSAVGGRAWVVPDIHSRIDGPGVIGWHQLDEADLNVKPGALPRVNSNRRVTFLTLSSHFWTAAAPGPLPRDQYPAMIARAGMVGFDLYPLTNWCRRVFRAVYEAQQALVALAAGKPTYQWIEAGPMGDSPCAGIPSFQPLPYMVHAEVWLAVAGGARGIGYFPGHFDAAIAREVARTNVQLAALAPVLLSPTTPVTVAPNSPLKAGARSYDGATWVIAVNSTLRTVKKGSFAVPGFDAESAIVWGENRTVPVGRGGRITDAFAPLEVHIYVCRN